MPYKLFVAGEEALASDVNSYLMSQTVPRFPSAAARDAAITAPVKGQVCIIDTTPSELLFYTGSAWAIMGWSYYRFVHSTPALVVPANSSNAFEFPALTFARNVTIMTMLQAYASASAVANQSVNTDFIVNSAGVAPTTAPVSVMGLNPFGQSTYPVTGLWRNVASGTNAAPKVRFAVGSGTPTITIQAISGILFLLAPGLEFP
jgi:hypothetical protein